MQTTSTAAVATAEKIWNACLYVRLSREDGDKEESDSITNQKALIRDYAATLPDINIVAEMADDGFSGASFERPSFIKMMNEIKAGHINCVIVKDLSRFGRNFTEAGKYLEQIFPFLGVRFISVNDRLDSMSSKSYGDRIIVPFKNLINEMYAKDISKKVRSSRKIAATQGKFMGSTPSFGYKRSETDKHKLIINENAAKVVIRMFQMFKNHESARHIAEVFNREDIPTPQNYYYQSMG